MNTHDLSPQALGDLVALLKNHPDFRLLERLQPRDHYFQASPESVLRKGIILDTETTGKDRADRIIELGMVVFEYDASTGQVYRVLERFNELEDPGMPIPPSATKVNGITDQMVQGKRVNDEEVNRMAMDADLVIAHNSGFDRPFVEERFPIFRSKPWACSLKQVDWIGEGMGSAKLDYLAFVLGFFHEAHRAIADCDALLTILQSPLPGTGALGLKYIVDAYQKSDINLGAIGSPFVTKDTLKARRVNLVDGSERKYIWRDVQPKGYWHIDLPEDMVDAETTWLQSAIYGGKAFQVSLAEVNAFNRFSLREAEREVRYFDRSSPQN